MLFEAHKVLGARLIDFNGWDMPVFYTGITAEHLAVRSAAGIFDISHMGQVMVGGEAALEFLNGLLTNDLRKLVPGQGQYTLMCNEAGGVVDDLYAYRTGPGQYLLVINASRVEQDMAWLRDHAAGFQNRVTLACLDRENGAVAVQGPRVREFVDKVIQGSSISGTRVGQASSLKKNQIASFAFGQGILMVACTGYTGEDGFEVMGPGDCVRAVWDHFLSAGAVHGLVPAGLGARDTLRTEMGYPLYGHELNETTTPIEAGLGFFVSLDKGQFVGRSVLEAQKASGTARTCVAFKMTGKAAPPRPHYPVWRDAQSVGEVVSGTQSPSLGAGIGMAYVATPHSRPGTALEIEIRGVKHPAIVVKKPLYRPDAARVPGS